MPRYQNPILLALGAASGVAALAYEVLWTRELLNLLGSTTLASTIVLAAFMCGFAIGAWAGGKWGPRLAEPLWLYVAAEALLAGFAVWFPGLAKWLEASAPAGLAPGLAGILVLPATLMGFTLPALAASLQNAGAVAPRFLARLYGLNALGGAIAAFVVGFVILPYLGLRLSELATAVLGAAAALLAAGTAARTSSRAYGSGFPEPESAAPSPVIPRAMIVIALFLSGAAALGYEVLWTRTLVLVTGSSSNAFSAMLGLYVLGLAAGSLAIGRRLDHIRQPAILFQGLQLGIAGTAIAGAALVAVLPELALSGHALLGSSAAAGALVSLSLAALVIVPPTMLIGAALPVGARLLQARRIDRGREIGLTLAAVTAGNVLGVAVAAHLIIPWIGLRHGLAALAMLNLLAAALIHTRTRRGSWRQRWITPAAATALIAVIFALPTWNTTVMTSGVFRHASMYLALLGTPQRMERAFAAYRTRYYREGSEAVVTVFDRPTLDGSTHRVLNIDGKVDASTGADMATQVLSGYLPSLFRPDARNALVIGLASGVTAGKLAEQDIANIDIVEIEPAVVEASRLFDDYSGAPLDDPRVNVFIGDGRRYLHTTGTRYDIVVSEPSNPWLSMSARLFTREFFELVRARLSERGILVQWVPLYALGKEQFAVLLRTLIRVFPQTALLRSAEGDLLVVAGTHPLKLSLDALDSLYRGPGVQSLAEIGFGTPAALLGAWIADGAGLRGVLDGGLLNTDDNGMLELGSPWYLQANTTAGNAALVERAGTASSFLDALMAALVARGGDDLIVEIANRHLQAGRTAPLRQMTQALRNLGRNTIADLIAGDAALAQGRPGEARRLWSLHDSPQFWRREGVSDFRLGDPRAAAALLSRIAGSELNPDERLILALSLAADHREAQALDELDRLASSPLSAAVILGALGQACLYATRTNLSAAETARAHFEDRLDSLRRCLERDGCRPVLDEMVSWVEADTGGLPVDCREELRRELYLRILRPTPIYYRAVSSLWLGDYSRAAVALKRYLALLPEEDSVSRARTLLKNISVSSARKKPDYWP